MTQPSGRQNLSRAPDLDGPGLQTSEEEVGTGVSAAGLPRELLYTEKVGWMESYQWAALEVAAGLNPLLAIPAPREDPPPSKCLPPPQSPAPSWEDLREDPRHHSTAPSLPYPGGPRPSLARSYLQVCTS